ncbi:MAG: DNA translocase FtsK 4TM domain-containing protein [Oliverpabstia sp.]
MTTAASTKNKKGPKKNSRKKSSSASKKTVSSSKKVTNSLGLEIIVLIFFALTVLLMISNFDMGGAVGNTVSQFCFGMMGWMAYLFPFILFFGVAFYAVNRNSSVIYRKINGLILSFWCLMGILHLFTVGYAKGETLSGYYRFCAAQKTGGGILGGLLSKLLSMAFGTIGAYVILFIALMISIILLTQRSILKPIKRTGEKVYREAKENHVRRKEERGTFAMDELKLPAKEEKKEEKNKEEKSQKEEPSDAEKIIPAFEIQRPDPVEIFPDPVSEEISEQPLSNNMAEIKPERNDADKKQKKSDLSVEKIKKNPKSSQEEIANGIESIKNEIENKEKPEVKKYIFPPLTLLKRGKRGVSGDSDQQVRETALKLQNTLLSFGVNAAVTNVSCGPTVTRYELQPEQGVKVSKIVNLADDIKLNLAAADIRIEAPIPGKAAIGIEVPNATNSAVMLRDLLESKEFQEFPSELAFAVGKDIGGKTVVADIGKMPHLLIAGATGSGKSVCINTLIMSILYKATPDEVKLIMIDPKVVELSVYNGIPHLFIPVVTDPKKAAGALNWAVAEMTDRYNKFAEYNVRDLKGYNEKVAQLDDIADENKPKRMPKIIIIVDELADLMMVAPGEVEDAICRLAQLARAAGIHLIIATQRPSVNVITGLIKANMPSRIAFSVSSGVDSRTILDMVGAEKLLGKGDMLYYPQGYQKPARLQGSFVSDPEVSQVVSFLTDNHQSDGVYDQKITDMMNSSAASSSLASGGEDVDAYFVDAGKFIIEKDKASIGMLQRAFKIGFNRAARIMDQLSDAGVVGPEEGTKPRKILMSQEEFENYIEESL